MSRTMMKFSAEYYVLVTNASRNMKSALVCQSSVSSYHNMFLCVHFPSYIAGQQHREDRPHSPELQYSVITRRNSVTLRFLSTVNIMNVCVVSG